MRLVLAGAVAVMPALAHAQAVRISGEGRMGVIYERISVGAASTADWAQENRLVLNFDVAVSADHGLSFGAHSRVQIDNGTTGRFSGSHVYVEASGFRLSFGNLDGAILTAGTSHGFGGGCGVGYVGGQYCADAAGLVFIPLDPLFVFPTGNLLAPQVHEFDYTGGGSASMFRLDYSVGRTDVALSRQRDDATEFGLRTRFDSVTLALGYSNRVTIVQFDGVDSMVPIRQDGSLVTVSGHYDGGTWGVGVLLARIRPSILAQGATNWSVSGNVELASGNLYAYLGRVHHIGNLGPAPVPFNTAGLGYGYRLGEGATLTAGIERIAGRVHAGVPVRLLSASVGVAFNF